MQLWDTAGLPEYEAGDAVLVRNAAVVVLAYTTADSFIAIQTRWYPLVQQYAPPHAALVLARCQSVLGDACHAAYARDIGATYAVVTAESRVSMRAFMKRVMRRIVPATSPRTSDDRLVACGDNPAPRYTPR